MKELNNSLAADLNRVAASLRRMGEIHSAIAKTYEGLDVNTLTDVHETLGEAFLKLRSSCITMRKLILSDFVQFFRYEKYELNAIEDLINSWSDKRNDMNKTEKKLREKKDQLFTQQLVAKWELSPNCKIPVDTLLKDKAVAFREMLPKDTQEAQNQRILFGYYSNKILEEFLNINKKDESEIKTHFYSVARKSCDIFEDINVMWADMVAHFTEIKDHVDTSDEKIVQAHALLPPNAFEKKARLLAMQKKLGH